MSKPGSIAPFAVTLALLSGVAGLVVHFAAPPAVIGADAPKQQFSAARARVDIDSLTALGPRPLRPRDQPPLPSHAQARQLIVQRLLTLGMSPQLQIGELKTPNGSIYQVENVIGRLDPPNPGSAATDAVVLLSHYDSVAAGPGAGDAASGTSTVLEIARALRETATLRRPLIVVIDDGEEVALLGARLFLQHPFAAQAKVVLNFEARGTSGQTAMFETSDRSAWLVELYGRHAARPVASSVIYSLYRLLPNDTDLTVTKAAGLFGLNFAFADADWNYHTSRDDLAHLDLRSVQHMGDQGLAVARALIEEPRVLADRPPAGLDAVWFDLFTKKLVVYHAATAIGLALLMLGAYLGAIGLFVKNRGARAIGDGLLRFLTTLVVFLPTGMAVHKLIAGLAGAPHPWRQAPLPTFSALVLAGVAVSGGVQWLFDRRARSATASDEEAALAKTLGLAIGALLPSLLAALWLTFSAVGASYPFTLPALFLALPILALQLRPASPNRLWAALLPGLLGMAIVWFPLLRVVRVMVGAQVAFAVLLPTAICLGFYEPLARLFPARLRSAVPIGAGIAMLLAIAVAAKG